MKEEQQNSGVSPEAERVFDRHLTDSQAGLGKSLEAVCGEHPELAEELRALMTRWEKVAGDSLGEDLPPNDLARRLAEHSHPESRYEIRGEFARGGMGVILKVWDKDLRRDLAMKVVLTKEGPRAGAAPAVDELKLGRFLEEAQVTGQLDHPGVVPVHELGVDAHGRIYFTMRLVKGLDLGAVLELMRAGQEGWTRTRVLGVLLKVCEAMAYAHSKGVVHRDLKPANVMVGRFGEVYVMDWGLARVVGRKDPHDLRLSTSAMTRALQTERSDQAATPDSPIVTMDGTVVGTPAYMPPEQAEGRVEELGPAADVYSLGAILYEVLTGQKPYVTPGARPSPHTILAALVSGPPAPIEQLTKDVPAELVAICERAMARDLRRRYADMSALAEDLSAFLEHRVVSAYRTGAVAELRKWVERNRALAGSLAMGVLALVAGMLASWVLKGRSDRSEVLAQERGDALALTNESLARTNAELELRRKEAEERRHEADLAAAREKARADEVLSLSALQKLDDLSAEADRLWPARPENSAHFEAWLARAAALLQELPAHQAKLAELRAKAVPWTREDEARHRAEHPRLPELESAQRHVAYLRALRAALETGAPPRDPRADEVGVVLASLPASANEVSRLAWPLVDPERKDWGGEARGLALARHALALGADLAPVERAGLRNTVAWALFANGRFDEAVAEEEKAVGESASRQREFRGFLEDLKDKIAAETDPKQEASRAERLAVLERHVAALEAEVSQRSDWLFGNSEDQWWHNQLEKLTSGLAAFADAETGLASSGNSLEHGWGIQRRAEFARTIAERSVSGAEAAARWAAATRSIANVAECPRYKGLRISPQLGLLPLGPDPDSGLWEFAELQTGEPARRDADGMLVLKEATGIVLVLLPRGSFTMGAQNTYPQSPNYDPQAELTEGPPRDVPVEPFFLAKYEMTQGQWLRFTGQNPSRDRLGTYSKNWNRDHRAADLLHPVEQVNWTECTAVLARLGLDLPTGAEWEYGARAGTSTVWWCGSDKEFIAAVGNVADAFAKANGGDAWGTWEFWDDGNTCHAPVGSYAANDFGLHDVIGNVWEWCLDNDQSGSAHRFNRGGCFALPASFARSAMSRADMPEDADGALGLRPARRLEP